MIVPVHPLKGKSIDRACRCTICIRTCPSPRSCSSKRFLAWSKSPALHP